MVIAMVAVMVITTFLVAGPGTAGAQPTPFSFPYAYGTPAVPASIGAQGTQGPNVSVGSLGPSGLIGAQGKLGPVNGTFVMGFSNAPVVTAEIIIRNGTLSSSVPGHSVPVALLNATGKWTSAKTNAQGYANLSVPAGHYVLTVNSSSVLFLPFQQMVNVAVGSVFARYLAPAGYALVDVGGGGTTTHATFSIGQVGLYGAYAITISNCSVAGSPRPIATGIMAANDSVYFFHITEGFYYCFTFDGGWNPVTGVHTYLLNITDTNASITGPYSGSYGQPSGISSTTGSVSGTAFPGPTARQYNLLANTTITGGVTYLSTTPYTADRSWLKFVNALVYLNVSDQLASGDTQPSALGGVEPGLVVSNSTVVYLGQPQGTATTFSPLYRADHMVYYGFYPLAGSTTGEYPIGTVTNSIVDNVVRNAGYNGLEASSSYYGNDEVVNVNHVCPSANFCANAGVPDPFLASSLTSVTVINSTVGMGNGTVSVVNTKILNSTLDTQVEYLTFAGGNQGTNSTLVRVASVSVMNTEYYSTDKYDNLYLVAPRVAVSQSDLIGQTGPGELTWVESTATANSSSYGIHGSVVGPSVGEPFFNNRWDLLGSMTNDLFSDYPISPSNFSMIPVLGAWSFPLDTYESYYVDNASVRNSIIYGAGIDLSHNGVVANCKFEALENAQSVILSSLLPADNVQVLNNTFYGAYSNTPLNALIVYQGGLTLFGASNGLNDHFDHNAVYTRPTGATGLGGGFNLVLGQLSSIRYDLFANNQSSGPNATRAPTGFPWRGPSIDIALTFSNGYVENISHDWFLNLNSTIVPIFTETGEGVYSLAHPLDLPLYGDEFFYNGGTQPPVTSNPYPGPAYNYSYSPTLPSSPPFAYALGFANKTVVAAGGPQLVYNSSFFAGNLAATEMIAPGFHVYVVASDVNISSGVPVISFGSGLAAGPQPNFLWHGYNYSEQVEQGYIEVGVNSSMAPAVTVGLEGPPGLAAVNVYNSTTDALLSTTYVTVPGDGVYNATFYPSGESGGVVISLLPSSSPLYHGNVNGFIGWIIVVMIVAGAIVYVANRRKSRGQWWG